MMTAGRPRKPARVRQLEGNRGHRPIPPDPVLQDAGPLKRPVYLKGRAAELFDEYADFCGWLDAADSRTLALFSDLLIEAEKGAAKMPAAKISAIRNLASDLGLVARTKERLRYFEDAPPPPPDPDNPASEFFE